MGCLRLHELGMLSLPRVDISGWAINLTRLDFRVDYARCHGIADLAISFIFTPFALQECIVEM